MVLSEIGYSYRLALFEKCLNKLSQILFEISRFDECILKKAYFDSEVPHLIKALEWQGRQYDRRLDLSFYFHDALKTLERSFSSGLCLLNKRESEIYFEFKNITEEYYQICIEIEPKYKISAVEFFEFLAKNEFVKVNFL